MELLPGQVPPTIPRRRVLADGCFLQAEKDGYVG
jgi:hypothetical protein